MPAPDGTTILQRKIQKDCTSSCTHSLKTKKKILMIKNRHNNHAPSRQIFFPFYFVVLAFDKSPTEEGVFTQQKMPSLKKGRTPERHIIISIKSAKIRPSGTSSSLFYPPLNTHLSPPMTKAPSSRTIFFLKARTPSTVKYGG